MVVRHAPLTIWERILDPGTDGLTPEAAQYLLRLDFTPADHARMEELGEMASAGTLTPEDRVELDDYVRVGHHLARLQSQARVALRSPAGDG